METQDDMNVNVLTAADIIFNKLGKWYNVPSDTYNAMR